MLTSERKTSLIPAIRYACRAVSLGMTNKDVEAKIRDGCQDDVPISDEEATFIMEEATRIVSGYG